MLPITVVAKRLQALYYKEMFYVIWF